MFNELIRVITLERASINWLKSEQARIALLRTLTFEIYSATLYNSVKFIYKVHSSILSVSELWVRIHRAIQHCCTNHPVHSWRFNGCLLFIVLLISMKIIYNHWKISKANPGFERWCEVGKIYISKAF